MNKFKVNKNIYIEIAQILSISIMKCNSRNLRENKLNKKRSYNEKSSRFFFYLCMINIISIKC